MYMFVANLLLCCVIMLQTVIDILFYVQVKNISLIRRRRHCRWKDAKFKPMFGAQDLWAGRVPSHRKGTPFSPLLRHTRVCGGSIPIRILMGPNSVAPYDTQGDAEDLFLPGSSQVQTVWYETLVRFSQIITNYNCPIGTNTPAGQIRWWEIFNARLPQHI
jgi:hypothetical protein